MTPVFYSHSADASTSYRPSSAAPSGTTQSAAVNGNLSHIIKNGHIRIENQGYPKTTLMQPQKVHGSL